MDKAVLKEIDRKVGKKIKETRLLRGLSQEKLAEACGLSFQQIQKYERGANRVSASRLVQMAQILEVPVTRFFEDLLVGEPENDDREFLRWVALYNKTPPKNRKVLFEIRVALSSRHN